MGILRKRFNQQEKPTRINSGTYIPASQVFQCPSLFWLKNNLYTYPNGVERVGIERETQSLRGSVGSVFESWVISTLIPQISGVSIIPDSIQMPISFSIPYIHTRGFIDFLVEYEGKAYVVDVKAMSEWRFNNFVDRGCSEQNEKDIYAQMQIYLSSNYLHSVLSPHELAGAIILAVNTNNNEWIDEWIKPDVNFIEDVIIPYVEKLNNEVKNLPSPPNCGYYSESYPCSSCPANFLHFIFTDRSKFFDISSLSQEEQSEILEVISRYAEHNLERRGHEDYEEKYKEKIKELFEKYKTLGFKTNTVDLNVEVTGTVYPKSGFDFNKFKFEETEIYRKYKTESDVLRINPPKVV